MVELDHAVVGRSEEALLLVGRHVRVDRRHEVLELLRVVEAAPASGRGGSRDAGRPAAPRRGRGHVPDRAVGPGQQSALLGEAAAVRPQAAVPRVVALGRRVPVGELAEGLRPGARAQVAGPRLERRLALGQLVLGVPRDLPRVDREEVPFPEQQVEGLRPAGVALARRRRDSCRRWRWNRRPSGRRARRRRGAAAPRRRGARGSPRARRPRGPGAPRTRSRRARARPPARRGPPGAPRGAGPGSPRCGAAPPPGAARSPRTAAARGR